MMTRELALGMMRQADNGEQMLTVADAIVSLSEDLNIADATAHFEQLNAGPDPEGDELSAGDHGALQNDIAYLDMVEQELADQADYETEMFAQQA